MTLPGKNGLMDPLIIDGSHKCSPKQRLGGAKGSDMLKENKTRKSEDMIQPVRRL